MSNPCNDEMTEDHLDCSGKKRNFVVRSYGTGAGLFLEAVEMHTSEARGLRIVMRADADGRLPYGEIRERIRSRLSERSVARDPDTGRLEILNRTVRCQITDENVDRDDEASGPNLYVDDQLITWTDLGRMLVSYNGFGLRIEVRDPGEE